MKNAKKGGKKAFRLNRKLNGNRANERRVRMNKYKRIKVKFLTFPIRQSCTKAKY